MKIVVNNSFQKNENYHKATKEDLDKAGNDDDGLYKLYKNSVVNKLKSYFRIKFILSNLHSLNTMDQIKSAKMENK